MTTYQVGQRVVRFRGAFFVEVGMVSRETEKLVFIHPYGVDDTGQPSIHDYATYRWSKNHTHAMDDATFGTWVRMERDQNVWREKLRKLETERRQAQLPFHAEIAAAVTRKTGGL